MASVSPDIKVELYTPAYATWFDVSQYLRPEGVAVRRGRGTRYDTSGPGTCSFVLNNSDGRFTPGNTSGAYYSYGNWGEKNQPVRVTVNGVQVFLGVVDTWTVSVTSAGECTAAITVSDALKFLNQNPLASFGVERVRQIIGSTGVVWPLASAVGSASSAQWSAYRNTNSSYKLSLNTAAGAGQYEWSSEAPPYGDGSFHGLDVNASGNGVGVTIPYTFDPGSGGSAFGAFRISPNATSASTLFYMDRSGTASILFAYVDPGSSNKVVVIAQGDSMGAYASFTSSVQDLHDDAWHTFALVVAATGKTVTLYIDGTSVGSTTTTGSFAMSATNRRAAAGATSAGGSGIVGYLSTLAVTSAVLTSGNVTSLHNAVIKGDTGDSISTRATNVLANLTIAVAGSAPTLSVSNTSGLTLAGQDTKNKTALAVLNEIADTERGVVYCDRLGNYKFRGSAARTPSSYTTLDCLADLDGSRDTTLTNDDSLFANQIIAQGPAGELIVQDSTSVSTIGTVVSETWTCVADSLSTPANNRLTDKVRQDLRVPQVTVDLLTCTSVSASTVAQLVPLDAVTLTNLPSALGASSQNAVIEGYELVANVDTYAVTLDLSPIG